jgi:hypothetical protein
MSILKHLQDIGPLTPKEALNAYGSFRLAAHIEALRRQGHPISTEMVKEGGREFARYHYRKARNEQSSRTSG